MIGALAIANGFRESFWDAWAAYRNALGFKPPLICIPAGILMWLSNGGVLSGMLSMIVVFISLGLIASNLFLYFLPVRVAAVSTAILLAMPMITGLTHRFYTENILLLLCLSTITFILHGRFHSYKFSILTGISIGLGILCKSTFIALILLPLTYLFSREVTECFKIKNRKRVYLLIRNLILIIGIALLISATWYSNGQNALHTFAHATKAAKCCGYPVIGSILSNISSGPSVFIFVLSIFGSVLLIVDILKMRVEDYEKDAWIAILLLGLVTFALTTFATNKATRFTVTLLPSFAILAGYFPFRFFKNQKTAIAFSVCVVFISFIMVLHNSFGILPIRPIRINDLRIIDSKFPLNIPDWFDDNAPLDCRNYPWDKVDNIIANDATLNLSHTPFPVAELTVNCLVFNHDYFNLLANLNHHQVIYTRWKDYSLTNRSVKEMPQYILRGINLQFLKNENRYREYYPEFENEIKRKRLPYIEIGRIEGPNNSSVIVYRKKSQ